MCVSVGYAEKSREVPMGDSRRDRSGDSTSSDDCSPKTLSHDSCAVKESNQKDFKICVS